MVRLVSGSERCFWKNKKFNFSLVYVTVKFLSDHFRLQISGDISCAFVEKCLASSSEYCLSSFSFSLLVESIHRIATGLLERK